MWNKELKKLQSENKELSRDLHLDDAALIEDIIGYMDITKISTVEQEILRKDLIGMALEARIRGETLADVIGPVKEFCDTIIAGSSHANKQEYWLVLLRKLMDKFMFFCLILAGLQLYSSVTDMELRTGLPQLWLLGVITGGTLYTLLQIHVLPRLTIAGGTLKYLAQAAARIVGAGFLLVLWLPDVVRNGNWIVLPYYPLAIASVVLWLIVVTLHERWRAKLIIN